ncbi:MAG: hypothetical protein SGI92_06210, partial [Bryobacteraceae bacterium]|nr:hypothetical protein [Bryobacteraceae bacterium]
NFDCLKGTPAHESVRVALARVAEARWWVREKLAVAQSAMTPAEPAGLPLAERRRMVMRRMARLAP